MKTEKENPSAFKIQNLSFFFHIAYLCYFGVVSACLLLHKASYSLQKKKKKAKVLSLGKFKNKCENMYQTLVYTIQSAKTLRKI